MKIKIKQISHKSDRVPPIVAYFASGYDPFAKNSESGVRETPKVTVYKHKDESKKRLQVVVSPPDSNVEFVGSNYTGEQTARQTCVYKLGVLNKETHTLKILPIAHNKILRLEPRVKIKEIVDSEASVSSDTESSGNEDMSELTEEERLKRKATKKLTKRFCSVQVINRDKKKRALNLGYDPATKEVLKGKLNKVNVKTSALKSNSIVARNIPPYDTSVTIPSEAYPIQKIIEKGEWLFLQDIYLLLQQETEAVTDNYPVFVSNRWYKLRAIKDETEKQTVCGVLSLLTHMVKFKDMNSMNGFDSAKDHRFPGMIREKCMSLFKDPESDKIPIDRINLLIRYILVLALHVDNFKTNPEDIAKDLRMSKVDVRKHFENLGCKITRDKSIVLATLPVPLKFPEITRKRRR